MSGCSLPQAPPQRQVPYTPDADTLELPPPTQTRIPPTPLAGGLNSSDRILSRVSAGLSYSLAPKVDDRTKRLLYMQGWAAYEVETCFPLLLQIRWPQVASSWVRMVEVSQASQTSDVTVTLVLCACRPAVWGARAASVAVQKSRRKWWTRQADWMDMHR